MNETAPPFRYESNEAQKRGEAAGHAGDGVTALHLFHLAHDLL